MSKQERKRKTSLGVLFWIAAILLILVVFLFNRSNIQRVAENTGLVQVINQRIGIEDDQSSENQEAEDSTSPDGSGENVGESAGQQDEAGSESGSDTTTVEDESPDQQNDEADQSANSSDSAAEDADTSSEEQNESPDSEDSPPSRSRSYLIHLVEVGGDGSIALAAVETEVSFDSSPLTRTLETLIAQPGENSSNNLRNLIPPDTRINRIWIENQLAFIDMSEEFRINPMGREGHRLQLQQLVLTATQFPTVDAVQILIDGQLVDYLGGEGVYIGGPLAPASF